jgi:hypothetical protein
LLLAQGQAPPERVVLGGYAVDVPAARDALLVVDGQQRLSTLAMAFLDERGEMGRPVYFDLRQNRFVLGERRRAPPGHWVPTRALASSASLIKWLREAGIDEELSDRADEIARSVREYMIPAYLVPYDGEDDSLLKEIFARVNRQGRALRRHEVFQALHRSKGSGDPLTRVVDSLTAWNFGRLELPLIERTTLAVGGFRPTGDLQDLVKDAAQEDALFDRVTAGLGHAVEFLRSDVGVP